MHSHRPDWMVEIDYYLRPWIAETLGTLRWSHVELVLRIAIRKHAARYVARLMQNCEKQSEGNGPFGQ
jgi:hypothetical protein